MKKQNIIKETILTLYRLRQINTEKNIIKETLSTYLSILRKMKRLPGLKPELIISKDIYLLSIEENKEKIIHLNGEKIKLITRLKLHSGTKLKNINSFLPDPIYNWPKIKKTIHLKSPLLAVAIFEREAAKSKFDIARSDSWPDLMLGPVFAHEGKNKNSFSGGITFSLTAPIFYNNDGERETSKKNIKLSILNITLLKKRLQVTRDAYLDQYNLYKSKLKRNNKNRSNRHKRLHRFLNRGMISASLVIEYHRQELEFREYSHKSEIEALNSLWSIYSIDGTILREANYEK